jgi:hypothetical protein
MIPGVWTKWSYELPPRDVEIEASYDDPPNEVQKGMRCKSGCCWTPTLVGMSCIPPRWWRVPASAPNTRPGQP